jgi:hypothetical protein
MKEYEEEEEAIKFNDAALSTPLREGVVLCRTPYSDIVISKDHLNEFRKDIYEIFCNWALDESTVEIDHSCDPPWDCSGMSTRKHVEAEILLEKYTTISQWMDKEYTGQSMPSYCSGMGLYYLTLDSEISEICDELAWQILSEGLPEKEKDDWRDSNLVDHTEVSLNIALHKLCSCISTDEAWDLGHNFTEENRAIEFAEQEAHQEKCEEAREIVLKFTHKTCPELLNKKLYLNNKAWIVILKNATCRATYQELEALALIGYTLSFSNKAKDIMNAFIEKN